MAGSRIDIGDGAMNGGDACRSVSGRVFKLYKTVLFYSHAVREGEVITRNRQDKIIIIKTTSYH